MAPLTPRTAHGTLTPFFPLCALDTPEVLRHSRLRVGKPGSKFSPEESKSFHLRVRRLFQKRQAQESQGGADPREQQMTKKRAKTIPLLATFDWLRALDNSLRCGLGADGLATFQVEGAGFDATDSDTFNVDTVPLLTLGMDSESKQRSGFYYMRSRGFSVVMLQPLHHRKNNDVELALSRAGFMPTMKRRLLIANIAYGPWHTSVFHLYMRDSACDLSTNLSADDGTLLMLWPRICTEKGWAEQHEKGPDARKAFIADNAISRTAVTKGPKASHMRWMSILQSIAYADRELMAILLHQAIQKQWVVSFEDIWKLKDAPVMAKRVSAILPALTNQRAPKAVAKSKSALRGGSMGPLCHSMGVCQLGVAIGGGAALNSSYSQSGVKFGIFVGASVGRLGGGTFLFRVAGGVGWLVPCHGG